MAPAKRSADEKDCAFDSRPPRRSRRTPKPRDFYLKQVLTADGVIEWTTEEIRGLNQPGEHKLAEEQRAEKQGFALYHKHLVPAGWTHIKRPGLGSSYIYVAPGTPTEKEEKGVNMFVSYEDIFYQYEKDGQTMETILTRCGRKSNTGSRGGSPAPGIRGNPNVDAASRIVTPAADVAVKREEDTPISHTVAAVSAAATNQEEPFRLNHHSVRNVPPVIAPTASEAASIQREQDNTNLHQNNITPRTASAATRAIKQEDTPAEDATNLHQNDVTPRTASAATRAIKQEDTSAEASTRERNEEIVLSSDSEDDDEEGQRPEVVTVRSSTIEVSLANSNDDVDGEEEAEHRIRQLRDWIMKDVIGHDPVQKVIESYARELYKEGYHSIQMVRAFLQENEVMAYPWMAPLHKRRFLACIRDGW